MKSFLSLRLESSISQNIRNFFRAFFLFLSLESFLLKFFILRARKFHFPKYIKSLFQENVRKFDFSKYKKSSFLRKYQKFFQSMFFQEKQKIFEGKILRVQAGKCVRYLHNTLLQDTSQKDQKTNSVLLSQNVKNDKQIHQDLSKVTIFDKNVVENRSKSIL